MPLHGLSLSRNGSTGLFRRRVSMPSHGLSLSYGLWWRRWRWWWVSMPSHGLSLSQQTSELCLHSRCFNALTRAKPIFWHWCNTRGNAVSMPSHGLNLSHQQWRTRIIFNSFNALTRAKPIGKYAQKLFFSTHLSLCTSPLYLKIPRPSITFHQILQSFLAFPARHFSANLPHFRPPTAPSATQISKNTSIFHWCESFCRYIRQPIFLPNFRLLPLSYFKSALTFSLILHSKFLCQIRIAHAVQIGYAFTD